MAKASHTERGEIHLEHRTRFKALLAQNLNYFGNLDDTELKPVLKVVGNPTYEELTCVGYNPEKGLLEATIAVKRPEGYGGDLCQAGSTEYVRFFVDFGSGWQDVGLAGVRVHDVPDDKDCAGAAEKPLMYVASLAYNPTGPCCDDPPALPGVRAILLWQWVPPAGGANAGWNPPWGGRLESNVQLKPRPYSFVCLFDKIDIDLPDLVEAIKDEPIPLPDPSPLKLGDLATLYAVKDAPQAADSRFAAVEPHRFGVTHLHAALAAGGFNQELLASKVGEWTAAGLDLPAALVELEKTKADVNYEEIECLGLDETFPERLVATFRIKRPFGYGGGLCGSGSTEYVAFWADWDDTCEWTYVGTQAVNLHDIPRPAGEDLIYSAIQPVDLTFHRRPCGKPKVGRVRAVLSWAVPPSTTDPDDLRYWGNRLDAHVQIAPGDVIDPNQPLAKIRNLGGIAVEDIALAGADKGMTKPTAFGGGPVIFANSPEATADAWGLNRPCPFGGVVWAEGNYFPGYWYRVTVHEVGSINPPSALVDDFYVERADIGFDHQVPTGEWFAYLDPIQEFERKLAIWPSSGDGLWEVTLDVATAPIPASIVGSAQYLIQLDNTAPAPPPAPFPTIDVHISSGGDCKDQPAGQPVNGFFIADDLHFGAWSLSTEPNTFAFPSNPPAATPFLAGTDAAPGPTGHEWALSTTTPNTMQPCGYVVRLDVSDRTIVNSVPGQHNGSSIAVGFCLRSAM